MTYIWAEGPRIGAYSPIKGPKRPFIRLITTKYGPFGPILVASKRNLVCIWDCFNFLGGKLKVVRIYYFCGGFELISAYLDLFLGEIGPIVPEMLAIAA